MSSCSLLRWFDRRVGVVALDGINNRLMLADDLQHAAGLGSVRRR